MIGAIAGDIVGSVYEHDPIKTKAFPLFRPDSRFTDDTVLTVAIARAILDGRDYAQVVREVCRLYPDVGYGASFLRWLHTPYPRPYGSWGNGAAMRISAVAYAFDRVEEVLEEARRACEFTHDHREGIRGAQAVALSIYLARTGNDKDTIRHEVKARFGYDLDRSIDSIRPDYTFDVTCQGSVPEAILCFLDSDSWEDTVRNAVSLGGDSDTLACMAGGIAEAYHGPLPVSVVQEVKKRLPRAFWRIVEQFYERYGVRLCEET